jgi:hypothetical protein
LIDVPGKFEVSALGPAMELKRVLFPQLGWPIKTTVGTLDDVIDLFDEDLLGDAAAQGDFGVRGDVPNENGALKNGLGIEFYDIAFVETHGEEAAADNISPKKIDDPHGFIFRCI